MMRGVLYGALGDRYVRTAQDSARSVKKQMPNIHITLYTDVENVLKNDWGFFDDVRPLPVPENDRDRIAGATLGSMLRTPLEYDVCLYLDVDIFVCDDLSDVFELVEERFDLGTVQATHALARRFPLDGIPQAFPFYNPGVTVYRRTDAVMEFFRDWQRLFDANKKRLSKFYKKGRYQHHDMPTFRTALWRSGLQIASMRREYQCRYWTGMVTDKVKILHTRGSYRKWRRWAAELNREPSKVRFYSQRKIQVVE